MRALSIDSRVRRLGMDIRGIPGLEAAWLSRFPYGLGRMDLPADGTAMGTWMDLSGKGRDLTQGTTGSQPLWRKTGVNLLPIGAALSNDTGATIAWFQATVSVTNPSTVPPSAGGPSVFRVLSGGSNSLFGLSETNVSGAKSYSASVLMRSESPTPVTDARTNLYWYNSSHALLRTDYGPFAAITSGTWTRVGVTKSAPDGAVTVRFEIQGRGDSGSYWEAAAPQFEQSPTATPWLPPGNAQGMQFDGTKSITAASLIRDDSDLMIYLCESFVGSVSGGVRVGLDDGNTSTRHRNDVAGTTVQYVRGTASLRAANSPSPATSNAPQIYTMRTEAGSFRIAMNGQFGQAVTYDPTSNLISLRLVGTANTLLIHDVIICSQAHDDATRQRVEAGLARANGVTLAP